MPLIGPLYYAVTLVEKGPRVPCKIWFGPSCDPDSGEELDRSPRWYCQLRGHDEPIETVWIEHMNGSGSIEEVPIMGGDQIDEKTYLKLLALREYAMTVDPSMPLAAPYSPIDRNKMKPIFSK